MVIPKVPPDKKNLSEEELKKLSLVYEDKKSQIKIYKDEKALPKGFLVNKCSIFNSYEDIYKRLRKLENIPEEVYIDKEGIKNLPEVEKFCKRNKDKPYLYKKVTPIIYSNQKITFKVNTDEPLILVLTEVFYPSWKVKVNGSLKDVFPAFGVYRGVLLDRGYSEVEFFYSPHYFYLGCFLFLIASIFLFFISYRKN